MPKVVVRWQIRAFYDKFWIDSVNPTELQTKAFADANPRRTERQSAASKDSERLPVYVSRVSTNSDESQLLALSLKDFFDIDHLLFSCLHVRGFV